MLIKYDFENLHEEIDQPSIITINKTQVSITHASGTDSTNIPEEGELVILVGDTETFNPSSVIPETVPENAHEGGSQQGSGESQGTNSGSQEGGNESGGQSGNEQGGNSGSNESGNSDGTTEITVSFVNDTESLSSTTGKVYFILYNESSDTVEEVVGYQDTNYIAVDPGDSVTTHVTVNTADIGKPFATVEQYTAAGYRGNIGYEWSMSWNGEQEYRKRRSTTDASGTLQTSTTYNIYLYTYALTDVN